MSIQCGPTSGLVHGGAAASFGRPQPLRDFLQRKLTVRPSSLAVIGLGAIGGSLAWQARLAGVAAGRRLLASRAEGVQALRPSAITELADTPAKAVAGGGARGPRRPRPGYAGTYRPAAPVPRARRPPDRRLQRQSPGARPGRRRGPGRPVRRRPSAGRDPRLGLRRGPPRPAARVRGLRLRDRGARRRPGRAARDAVLGGGARGPAGAHRRRRRTTASSPGPAICRRPWRPPWPRRSPTAGWPASRSGPAPATPRAWPPAAPTCGSTSSSTIAPPWSRRSGPPSTSLAELRRAARRRRRRRAPGLPGRRAALPRRTGPMIVGGTVRVPGRQEHHPPRAAVRRAGPGHESRGRRADLARRAQQRPGAAAARRRDLAAPARRASCPVAGRGRLRRPDAIARLRQLRARPPGSCSACSPDTASRPRSPAMRSLRRRPMRRVTVPLARMGARFTEHGGDGLPLTVRGGALSRSRYELPVSSAQIKSALLLAGLAGGVEVALREPHGRSRDHTERHAPRLRLPAWTRPTAGSGSRPTGRHRAVRARRCPATRRRPRFWSARPCWRKAASSASPAWASIRRGPGSSRCSRGWARRSRWRTSPSTSASPWPTWSCGRRALRATEVAAGRDPGADRRDSPARGARRRAPRERRSSARSASSG